MEFLYRLKELDEHLLILLNGTRTSILDWAMPRVTEIGSIIPFVLLFVCWRLYKGDNRERFFWIAGIMAVIVADALCARLLKPFFARPRPYNMLDGIYIIKKGEWLLTNESLRSGLKLKFSFPSCHAVNTWTAASYVSLFHKKSGLLLAAVAFVVSYSRIYLGVHYPGDTLFGAVTGILVGLSFGLLIRKGVPQ